MSQGRFQEALDETAKIAQINKWNNEVHAEITNSIKVYAATFKNKSEIKVVQGNTVTDDDHRWWNISLLIICWIATCFSYFIFVFFIKYLPADIYVVSIVSGLSTFGYLLQTPIAKRYNLIVTQQVSYAIVATLLTLLIAFGTALNTLLYALFILILKLFVCLGFGTIYVVHLDLFDSSFLGTSYGVCNVASRLAVIGAPLIAELDNKTTPLVVLLAMNLTALAVTFFLKKKKTQ